MRFRGYEKGAAQKPPLFRYKVCVREDADVGETSAPEGSVVAAPANQGCKTNPGSPGQVESHFSLIKKERPEVIPGPFAS